MASQMRQPGGPDPKPERRIRKQRAGVDKLRAEGKCRICPSTNLLARHHIVPKAQRGDDVDDNLMPLCEECHGLLHRTEGRAVRQRIRWRMTVEERLYVMKKMGAAWLDEKYPLA